jgi:hypothetical protein
MEMKSPIVLIDAEGNVLAVSVSFDGPRAHTVFDIKSIKSQKVIQRWWPGIFVISLDSVPRTHTGRAKYTTYTFNPGERVRVLHPEDVRYFKQQARKNPQIWKIEKAT